MITAIKAGLQSTLQGAPYSGHRHIGMAAAGAADCLSLALANRLVGKPTAALAIELTLSGGQYLVDRPGAISLTGAAEHLMINQRAVPLHQTIRVNAGDIIDIGRARHGARAYLALSGAIKAEQLLGGQSTYLAASLGGFGGRALRDGDSLETVDPPVDIAIAETPAMMRPQLGDVFYLRYVPGPEFHLLAAGQQSRLSGSIWQIDQQTNRMGSPLIGEPLIIAGSGSMASAPVFPGTIQCPPGGRPILLGPDAQTTGGYPRIAQIIRADRHLIGQLRPGGKIYLVAISPAQANNLYRAKQQLLAPWLGELGLW